MRQRIMALGLGMLLWPIPGPATAEEALVRAYIEARRLALLQEAPTGTIDGSVWSDLFARLLSELDIDGLDQSDGKITFLYKFPGLEQSPLSVQAQGILSQPELYEPLVKRLGDQLTAEAAKSLEEEFDDFDDFEFKLQVTWTPEGDSSKRLQRFARLLSDEKTAPIVLAALGPQPGPRGNRWRKKVQRMSWDRKLAEIEPWIRDQADVEKKKPQASLSVARRSRTGLVGPDETAATLSFSSSPAWQEAKKKQRKLLAALEKGRVPRHLAGDPPPEGAFKNLRWLVKAEYSEIEGFSSQRPDFAIDETFEGESKFTLTAGVGSEVCCGEDEKPLGRWDFALDLEDTEKDGTRSERTVASLTLTKGVPDKIEASFGLVWANKPEFLPDVDEEITARFGFRYKFPGQKPDERAARAVAELKRGMKRRGVR